MKAKVTKRLLKQCASFHTYTGSGNKIYAFFYEWKKCKDTDEKYWGGYKYLIKADAHYITKKELFELLYIWVNNGLEAVPEIINGKIIYSVKYYMAKTNQERFKIPLSMKL